MHRTETILTTPHRGQLFVSRFTPDAGEAANTVWIVHGLAEHVGRYEHIARMYVEGNFNVVVGDHRGHGRSAGVPTHVRTFRRYVDDLEFIRQHFDFEPDRTVILGHSMGGLIAARYMQKYVHRARALAMTSPLLAVRLAVPWTTIAMGKLLTLFAPRTRFQSRIDPSKSIRCPQRLKHRLSDPFYHRSVTASWYFAMKAALRKVWREAPRLTCPLLVVQAEDDHLVDPYAPEVWLAGTGSEDTTYRLLPGHLHELHSELDWQTTYGEVADWFTSRLPFRTLRSPAARAAQIEAAPVEPALQLADQTA